MECKKSAKERAHFFEEISNEEGQVEAIEEVDIVEPSQLGELGVEMTELLGRDDPKTNNLAIFEWNRERLPIEKDLESILKYLQIPSEVVAAPPGKDELTAPEMFKIAGAVQKGILQVNLNISDPLRMVTGFTYGPPGSDLYVLVKQGAQLKFLVTKKRGLAPIKEEELPDLFAARVKALPRRKK
jgi:hypothetical protein